MVDSLWHQRAGPVPQADVNDLGRARDPRGDSAFNRQIITGLNGRHFLRTVMPLLNNPMSDNKTAMPRWGVLGKAMDEIAREFGVTRPDDPKRGPLLEELSALTELRKWIESQAKQNASPADGRSGARVGRSQN